MTKFYVIFGIIIPSLCFSLEESKTCGANYAYDFDTHKCEKIKYSVDYSLSWVWEDLNASKSTQKI
jgi:hypothetical protein